MDYIFKRAKSLQEIAENKDKNVVWLYFDRTFFNIVLDDINYYACDKISITQQDFKVSSPYMVKQPIKELTNFKFFNNFIEDLKNYKKFKSRYPDFPYSHLYNAMCSFLIENCIESYTTYHQYTLINVL